MILRSPDLLVNVIRAQVSHVNSFTCLLVKLSHLDVGLSEVCNEQMVLQLRKVLKPVLALLPSNDGNVERLTVARAILTASGELNISNVLMLHEDDRLLNED